MEISEIINKKSIYKVWRTVDDTIHCMPVNVIYTNDDIVYLESINRIERTHVNISMIYDHIDNAPLERLLDIGDKVYVADVTDEDITAFNKMVMRHHEEILNIRYKKSCDEAYKKLCSICMEYYDLTQKKLVIDDDRLLSLAIFVESINDKDE